MIKVHQRTWTVFDGIELHPIFLETLTDFDGNWPIKVEYSDNALFYRFQQVKLEEKVDMTDKSFRFKVINQEWHNINNIFTLAFPYVSSHVVSENGKV